MEVFALMIGYRGEEGKRDFRLLECRVQKSDNGCCEWKFKGIPVTEQKLKEGLSRGQKVYNLAIEGGKVVGKAGALSRYDSTKQQFIIVAQIENIDGKTVGYKIADINGNVKNVPLKRIIGVAESAERKGGIAFPNAIFVPETSDRAAHLKSFPDREFYKEVLIQNKNKHTVVKDINEKENEKKLSKLSDIYTKEQIEQLRLGKEAGVPIKVYGNPELSAEQMKILRMALEDRLDIRAIAFPEYKTNIMRVYVEELRVGNNIKAYLNPKYNEAQIAQLSLGYESGVDLSKMANPSLGADSMAEIRLRLERGIWKDEFLTPEGIWEKLASD